MRTAIGLLLFASALSAGTPDGIVAGGMRWSDPRGAVSGSHRSTAIPVTHQLRLDWSYEVEGTLLGPPVLWDGLCYAFYRSGKNRDCRLVALDLQLGTPVAERRIGRDLSSRPVVWDGIVLLRDPEWELSGYQVVGRGFNRVWNCRPGNSKSLVYDPVVYENEVYVVSDGALIEYRLGLSTPVGRRGTGLFGRPALCGPYVYALGITPETQDSPRKIALYRWTRGFGAAKDPQSRSWNLGSFAQLVTSSPHLSPITADPDVVFVRIPGVFDVRGKACNTAVIDLRSGVPRYSYEDLAPVFARDGKILSTLRSEGMCWLLWELQSGKGIVLASKNQQPDLFLHPVDPDILGDVVYFGGWAADLETRHVLWRLDVPDLSGPLIPADGLVLAVSANKKILAFCGRGEP